MACAKNYANTVGLDALEQALCAQGKPKGVIHHSDLGSQYDSIRYSERLSEAGFNTSVASVGDSYDNALAEKIMVSSKLKSSTKTALGKGGGQVELATLD